MQINLAVEAVAQQSLDIEQGEREQETARKQFASAQQSSLHITAT
jgi:hypothetical protein